MTLQTHGAALINNDTQDVDKRYGIQALGNADIQTGDLTNQAGYIVANGLNLNANRVDNTQGVIGSSGGSVILDASGPVNNTRGLIQAQQNLTLQTHGAALINNDTQDADKRYGIQAFGSADIQTGDLTNQAEIGRAHV